MKRKLLIIASAVMAVFLFVGLSQAKLDRTEKSFEVTSGGTLYLDTHSGTIEIESHNRNTVEVLVETNDKEGFDVTFLHEGNDVRVTGENEKRWFGHSKRVRFLVKVPTNYNLDLSTGGGSIDLSNLTGQVRAHTSGGSIQLGQIIGDVNVKTSGGSIRVDDVAGNINAHTSGGSIRATLSTQPTEDCRLSTSGGSVTAYLSPSIAVDLDASTSGGRVSSDFSVNGTIKRNRIKGTINGGGPKLRLKTSGGSVSIKER